jgi:multicomponent Na+:H+ antiporter subunit D
VGNWTLTGVLLGLVSAALAVAGAAVGLYGPGVAAARRAGELGAPVLGVLRRVHSGLVTDYVAWLMTGVAVLGGLVGLPLR